MFALEASPARVLVSAFILNINTFMRTQPWTFSSDGHVHGEDMLAGRHKY